VTFRDSQANLGRWQRLWVQEDIDAVFARSRLLFVILAFRFRPVLVWRIFARDPLVV
jgi:hypothetical protein